MIDWNLGDILDAIEPAVPEDAPALIHGDRIISWPEMSKRSNNLARNLRAQGAGDGAKIAFYMRNRPEYGELMAACFKGRLTHVNINYRYRPEEVFYIFDDSDSEVIVYSSEFRDCILELKEIWADNASKAIGSHPRRQPTVLHPLNFFLHYGGA